MRHRVDDDTPWLLAPASPFEKCLMLRHALRMAVLILVLLPDSRWVVAEDNSASGKWPAWRGPTRDTMGLSRRRSWRDRR